MTGIPEQSGSANTPDDGPGVPLTPVSGDDVTVKEEENGPTIDAQSEQVREDIEAQCRRAGLFGPWPSATVVGPAGDYRQANPSTSARVTQAAANMGKDAPKRSARAESKFRQHRRYQQDQNAMHVPLIRTNWEVTLMRDPGVHPNPTSGRDQVNREESSAPEEEDSVSSSPLGIFPPPGAAESDTEEDKGYHSDTENRSGSPSPPSDQDSSFAPDSPISEPWSTPATGGNSQPLYDFNAIQPFAPTLTANRPQRDRRATTFFSSTPAAPPTPARRYITDPTMALRNAQKRAADEESPNSQKKQKSNKAARDNAGVTQPTNERGGDQPPPPSNGGLTVGMALLPDINFRKVDAEKYPFIDEMTRMNDLNRRRAKLTKSFQGEAIKFATENGSESDANLRTQANQKGGMVVAYDIVGTRVKLADDADKNTGAGCSTYEVALTKNINGTLMLTARSQARDIFGRYLGKAGAGTSVSLDAIMAARSAKWLGRFASCGDLEDIRAQLEDCLSKEADLSGAATQPATMASTQGDEGDDLDEKVSNENEVEEPSSNDNSAEVSDKDKQEE